MKRPDLVVTRETQMPSSIVELGYLTNQIEEMKVNDDNYVEKQANGIVRGINRYFN